MSIYQELKRRNVFRVGIAYAIFSWVLLQVVDVIAPIFELPDWAPRLVFLLLLIGLVPALIFAWAFEITPEGVKKEADVDRTKSIAGTTGKKLNYIIVASLAVAVVLLVVDRQLNRQDSLPVASDESAESEPLDRSIAVLPFVNMSSDSEQEYFSDGITEEILNSLASVKELKVAGRTSSFAFKGQNDDLRRIGDSLGVDHILEGSVRKAGNQVRITAQLIRVDNGFHLWSQTYDRELVDVFSIQDEIANEILDQLKLRLLANDAGPAEANRTNPEVYALYLRAKQRIYTRDGAEIAIAVKELDEAIELDPQYAPVYAQRGIATMLLSEEQYGSLSNSEANRRGKRFADQALDLNPNLAEAWAALGLYFSNQSGAQADEAIDALTKALAINPNLIDASNWLQIALRDSGDMVGSLQIIETMTERDPLYRPAFSNGMQFFNSFGQPEKAEALLARMASLNPDNPDLLTAKATNYLYSGRAGESLIAMEERDALGPMSGVGQIYLSLGLIRTGQFERATEEGSPFQRVRPLYEIGRIDEAFELAYRHAADGFPDNLFYLFLREKREQDLVDYLEERWPSISGFAEENPGDEFGYSEMSSVALAYAQLGEFEKSDEALMLINLHFDRMIDQGIDNFAFSASRAAYHAMVDDVDAAFVHLRSAVDNGWATVGDPVVVMPELQSIADDSRFAAIEATMLETVNRDRAMVGLPPFDSDYQVATISETL